MRYGLSLGLALGLVLALTTTSSAQFRPGQGGPGRGGGNDPLSLLRNPKVKEALKITDEQTAKLPEAVMKALEGVLNPEQLARLKQIRYQQMGNNALVSSEEVQTALKMTAAQKSDLKDITKEAGEVMKKIGEDFRSKDSETRKNAFKKMTDFRKEMQNVIMNVLTAEQKSQWEAMQGEEIDLRGGFGGFGGKKGEGGKGGKGGFGKKKAD